MVQLTVKQKLNKRSAIPATLPDAASVVGTVPAGFTFTGSLVQTGKLPPAPLDKWYQDEQGFYYWAEGLLVKDIQPPAQQHPLFTNLELPLTRQQCVTCARWMKTNFAAECTLKTTGTPFSNNLLYAIACQESAIYWQQWINMGITVTELLGRCVFDASGDANHTRSAFPKDTTAFIKKYGQAKADMLIAEANKTRKLRGWGPKQWVYAGYGIFQYDLQYIETDEAFFTGKKWYSINDCLDKAIFELNTKWKKFPNDLFHTVKAYNGSGSRAESYAQNVFQFWDWINIG